VEQELAAGLSERQIAELIEDDEVHAGQVVGEPALATSAGLGLKAIDEIDDVVKPAADTTPNAASRNGDGKMRFSGASPGSGQQGCRSRRWETSAVNCPFGRLAYPMRGEVTNRVLLGRKRHGCPSTQSGCRRWERPGWQQTRRPEDHRMTAAAKAPPF